MEKPVKMNGFIVDRWKACHVYWGVYMKMPVRRRFTSGRLKRQEAQAAAGRGPAGPALARGMLGTAILVLLAWGQSVGAQEKAPQSPAKQPENPSAAPVKDANSADESWWKKWDIPVKDPNNPNEVMTAKWNAVIKVLQAKELDQKTKERIMEKVVSPAFDFPLMGQLALGRTHWPKLNAAQREKFIKLFVERLKALYLEKTVFYTDEKITLKPGVPKKNTVQIPMVVTAGDKEIAILYKLHKLDVQGKGKGNMLWRIYDVEIEGVSILLTYRSQFDDILRRGTVEDLLAHLEKPPSQ
jgi:phospholipid transport system substrate-binding protein